MSTTRIPQLARILTAAYNAARGVKPTRKLPPRAAVVKFIEAQFADETPESKRKAEGDRISPSRSTGEYAHHYGLMELRELLDFLYDAPPQQASETLRKGIGWKHR